MSALKIGIARRDITPAPGTLLFGYSEPRGGEVEDALAATALALQSGATTAVLVSLDVAMIDETELRAIREAVHQKTGIDPSHVTVCATHTHSAPVTMDVWGWGKRNQEYLVQMRGALVEAVAEALGKLENARVGIGVGTTQTGVNRREVALDGSSFLGFNLWDTRDDKLTVMRFEGANGPLASLVHLSAHPTSRGTQPGISRDWPGVMLDRVEQVTGAPVLFINGSFGDVAPRTIVGGPGGDGAPAAREVGLLAANDALQVWRAIKEWRDAEVEVLCGEFDLPYAPLESREVAQAYLDAHPDDENARGVPGAEWNYYNAVLKAHDAAPRSARRFEQTLTCIGPLVVVPFAGEVFTDIALRLHHFSPFPYTLVAGTSNGSHGYYPTREARGRGGYEVWVARCYNARLLADNIDDVLVAENVNLLHTLNAMRGTDGEYIAVPNG